MVECSIPKVSSRVEEVASMARNIGYNVLQIIVQRRNSVHHSTCVGPGKLVEIRKLVEEKDIQFVIFANTFAKRSGLQDSEAAGRRREGDRQESLDS